MVFFRAGNVFNHEFDTEELLFHLRSINNGMHTKMGKFMTETLLKPAPRAYVYHEGHNPPHKKN